MLDKRNYGDRSDLALAMTLKKAVSLAQRVLSLIEFRRRCRP
jgi:hypothetical protein